MGTYSNRNSFWLPPYMEFVIAIDGCLCVAHSSMEVSSSKPSEIFVHRVEDISKLSTVKSKSSCCVLIWKTLFCSPVCKFMQSHQFKNINKRHLVFFFYREWKHSQCGRNAFSPLSHHSILSWTEYASHFFFGGKTTFIWQGEVGGREGWRTTGLSNPLFLGIF